MQHPFSGRQAFVGLLLIGLFAIISAQPRLIKWGRGLGLEELLTSRLHYLLFGWLLSECGLGALNHVVVGQMDELVTLGLSVLGLMLGLRWARGFGDRRIAQAAGVETLATLVLVGAPIFYLLQMGPQTHWQDRAAAAALVACTAAISGRRVFRSTPLARGWQGAINEVADVSTIIGVLAAGVLLTLVSKPGDVPPLQKLLATATIGVASALSAWLIADESQASTLRTVLVMGVLLIATGAASQVGVPPVVATLVMGFAIARLPGSLARDLGEDLAFLESPLRALLLVMAGAALTAPTGTTLIVVALFLALRTAGKILGGRLGSSFARDRLPEKMGLGLLPSSAIALGLALEFQAAAPSELAHIVLTAAVLGSLFSETAGVWTTRLLARAEMG